MTRAESNEPKTQSQEPTLSCKWQYAPQAGLKLTSVDITGNERYLQDVSRRHLHELRTLLAALGLLLWATFVFLMQAAIVLLSLAISCFSLVTKLHGGNAAGPK
jgi:hypothetical protein